MAQVIVRNLEDDVVERLKLKAELHGRSLEQELREILRAAAPLSVEQKLALVDRAHALTRGRAQHEKAEDIIRTDRDTR
jgi:antitoxin FitA